MSETLPTVPTLLHAGLMIVNPPGDVVLAKLHLHLVTSYKRRSQLQALSKTLLT